MKVGNKIKLIYEQTQAVVDIIQVTVDSFKVSSPLLGDLGGSDGNVFVYGREVDDFHTVDYEALSTLNISATQELLKQINELKREKETIKSALEGLKAEVGEIKKMLKRDN